MSGEQPSPGPHTAPSLPVPSLVKAVDHLRFYMLNDDPVRGKEVRGHLEMREKTITIDGNGTRLNQD